MKINNREIGPGRPPYCVAEIGGNHGGSLERCLKTMEAAKKAGADAVKFQAYEASTITLDCQRDEFLVKDGPWKSMRLWDLYKKNETPFEWFPKIAARANALEIGWFASCFDPSSVDMLEKLGCPAYKIASFEIVDLPLIRYAARTGKPVILSTGMASIHEVNSAILTIINEKNKQTLNRFEVSEPPIVLHCVSAYPASPKDYDLRKMGIYSSRYGVSDHTTSLEVPVAATALGACMIEKHFTLDYSVRTEDDAFSLTPHYFYEMVEAVKNTWAAMQPSERKEEHKPYRRSLFVVKEVKRGEEFTHDNVRSIRPGHGLPPKEIEQIVGKKAARDIERGEPMNKDMLCP